MIDMHCHILPGLCDGAQTLDEALELARIAHEDGIRHITATPHIHPGRYNNTRSIIHNAVEQFQQVLDEQGIPLTIGAGGEVRVAPEILILLKQNEIPFLGEHEGARVMLLEFPHSHIPLGSDKLMQALIKQNIRPLIAHPERNKDIHRDINRLMPFIDMGCLLQVTAGSVLGRFGETSEHRAKQLLEADRVHIIATDAHNNKHRPPVLSDCKHYISRWLGENKAEQLFNKNQQAMLKQKHKEVAA